MDVWRKNFVFPGSLVIWSAFRLLVVLFPSMWKILSAVGAWEYGAKERHTEVRRDRWKETIFIHTSHLSAYLNWVSFCTYRRKTTVHLERPENLHLRGEQRVFSFFF